MIGLAFFLPLDLSFSCWFIFLLRSVQRVIGYALGTRHYPALNDQASGSWIALFFIAVWVTRSHLIAVTRKIVGLETELSDSKEPMPYRWAFIGLIGSLALIGIFVNLAGMNLWTASIFFGLYFVLSIAITRVRAEL